ncbi:phospholipase C/P1 nuclease family protein [Sphingomonas hengshuiensis]|uniref:nuclease n=1 Tax=Sphingomonas hengshuiensis TaxID=1609977 RepID=UPI0012B812F6|nr:nuclease [Sphingomonas hengshuiensis]
MGHAVIDEAAIDALPPDAPDFLRKYKQYIIDTSSVPDWWREDNGSFSKIGEETNHAWYQEQLPLIGELPRSRTKFLIELARIQQSLTEIGSPAAASLNARGVGTMPYEIASVYGHLVTGFRWYRNLKAAAKATQSAEMACAFYVAWMGHYVGDGAQPLHVSVHHDGWQGANPRGYSTDRKLHNRFEVNFVESINLSAGDIRPYVTSVDLLGGDVFEAVLAYLTASHEHVEEVYQAEKRMAFTDANDQRARTLVYTRTAAGASMMRNLIFRAWLESAMPVDRTESAYDPVFMRETGANPARQSRAVAAGKP